MVVTMSIRMSSIIFRIFSKFVCQVIDRFELFFFDLVRRSHTTNELPLEFYDLTFLVCQLRTLNRRISKCLLNLPWSYIPNLPSFFYRDAKKLVKVLRKEWLSRAAKVGIRPQLVNLKNKTLMMDFLVVNANHSLHVLNAISPAFTSSMAFAKYVMQHYD